MISLQLLICLYEMRYHVVMRHKASSDAPVLRHKASSDAPAVSLSQYDFNSGLVLPLVQTLPVWKPLRSGSQTLKKSRRHLKILGASRVT